MPAQIHGFIPRFSGYPHPDSYPIPYPQLEYLILFTGAKTPFYTLISWVSSPVSRLVSPFKRLDIPSVVRRGSAWTYPQWCVGDRGPAPGHTLSGTSGIEDHGARGSLQDRRAPAVNNAYQIKLPYGHGFCQFPTTFGRCCAFDFQMNWKSKIRLPNKLEV